MPGQSVEEGGLMLGLHELALDTRNFFADTAKTVVDTRRGSRFDRLLRRKDSRLPSSDYQVLTVSSDRDSRTERMV
jgi:hypothetical protein